MTLNDLENTMVVQMRNQQLYLVITDCLPPNASKNKDIVFLSQGGYMQGTSYTFNMLMNTDDERYREWDIIKVFKRVYSNFDQNHRAPYSLKHLDSMLDLVCIWDREKDTCQEEIVNDNDFAINLDAVAYFNDEFVRFVNDWKMEISTKTYHLLRDYVHCKSKEVELKLNAPNQTESRTY